MVLTIKIAFVRSESAVAIRMANKQPYPSWHCFSCYNAASTALAMSAVPLLPPNSIGLMPPA
jgi:hypothetical protein